MTRRDFLYLAAGTPLLATGRRPSRRSGAAADAEMFVSLNGSVTRGVTPIDRARLAARLGFGGVDWDLGPAKTAGLEATKALFAELRIKPTIVNLPMPQPFPLGGEQADFADKLKAL